MRDARWVPLYDARLDTGAKDRKASLELVRRAEIVQRTGEDWANVALAVSTARTARGGSAPNLNTVIVRYPPTQVPRPVHAGARSLTPRLALVGSDARCGAGKGPVPLKRSRSA